MVLAKTPQELRGQVPEEVIVKVQEAYKMLEEHVSHIETGKLFFEPKHYVTIILREQEIELPKEVYMSLRELGFEPVPVAYGACGFATVEVREKDGKVLISVITCWCHPWSYLLGFQLIY